MIILSFYNNKSFQKVYVNFSLDRIYHAWNNLEKILYLYYINDNIKEESHYYMITISNEYHEPIDKLLLNRS